MPSKTRSTARDRLRNIEKVQFLDGGALNIIVGTPGNDVLNGTAQDDLILGLEGADMLNGGAGNDILVGGADGTQHDATAPYADNFNGNYGNCTATGIRTGPRPTTAAARPRARSASMTATATFSLPWRHRQPTSTARKSSALSTWPARRRRPSAIRRRSRQPRCRRERHGSFAADGDNFVTLNTINADNGATADDYTLVVTGPFTANAAIRFVATSMNGPTTVVYDRQPVVNSRPTHRRVDTLNGGLGDDTYSFTSATATTSSTKPSTRPAAALRIASRSSRRAQASIPRLGCRC